MKWIFVLEPALCQLFSFLLLLYNFRGGKRKFDTLCGCVESSGPTTWQQHTEYNFTTTVTKCHIWVFLKCETVIVTLRVSDWQWESDLGGTCNSCDVYENEDNCRMIIMMIIMTKMAIYCPQGSGTLRQQLLMMHWLCQSMPEYARVCQSIPEYARVLPSFAFI